MSRLHPSISCVLTLAIMMSNVFADTITLKTGEHLEGKITGETDKDFTMQVQVSAGITDERVVPKMTIEKVDRISPEILSYQAITGIQLGPDSLGASQYDPAIQALQAFVTQYPKSSRTPDVQTTLKAFQDEKKRAEAGDVKLDGQWLSKAEVEKDKVQIGARRAFAYMKGQSAAGDYIGALNTFAAIEKSFPGASVFPDAVDLAEHVINQLRPAIARAQANHGAIVVEQRNNLAAAGKDERAQMSTAIKQADANGDATVEQATKANNWPPLMQNNEKSLTALTAMATKEGTRLFALPVDKMKQSLQLTEVARQLRASGDPAAAAEKLKDATTLWGANELAKRMTAEMSADEKSSKATPAPAVAAPAAPVEQQAPATPKVKHITTPAPSTGAAAPVGAEGAQAQAGNDDDKPFIMTIPGIATAVIGLAVVLVGANVYMKKKKSKADQVEVI